MIIFGYANRQAVRQSLAVESSILPSLILKFGNYSLEIFECISQFTLSNWIKEEDYTIAI